MPFSTYDCGGALVISNSCAYNCVVFGVMHIAKIETEPARPTVYHRKIEMNLSFFFPFLSLLAEHEEDNDKA